MFHHIREPSEGQSSLEILLLSIAHGWVVISPHSSPETYSKNACNSLKVGSGGRVKRGRHTKQALCTDSKLEVDIRDTSTSAGLRNKRMLEGNDGSD
jgi:hypothetical protein